MGVKNCPETPRQRMINMMYLVLTALLALNVAAETLNAFKVVDLSLVKTFNSYTQKSISLMEDFQWQVKNGQNKHLATIYSEKAEEINSKSDAISAFITEIKTEMATQIESEKLVPGEELPDEYPYIVTKDNDTLILKRQDDLNVSPLIMIERGKGEELRNMIIDYRNQLISTIQNDSILKYRFGTNFFENIEKILDVSDPGKRDKTTDAKTWVQKHFDRTPLIASVTMLSKLQNDVRFAESLILNALYSALSEESSFEAKVIAKSNYIISGSQNFEAEIFLSAVTNVPEASVYINGNPNPISLVEGKALYKASTSTPGIYPYRGEIRYMYEGNAAIAPFSGEYEVAAPTAIVSPSKMNVLYRGIPNPVEISVPGVPNSQIRPVIDNGTIVKNGNEWMAMPTTMNDNSRINVYAMIDDREALMGFKAFRVKDVPPPKASLGIFTSGASIPPDYFDAMMVKKLTATLKDFLFDLEFEVTSFDVSIPTGAAMTATFNSASENFSGPLVNTLANVQNGNYIRFENIKAKIKGSSTVTNIPLDPAIFYIKN